MSTAATMSRSSSERSANRGSTTAAVSPARRSSHTARLPPASIGGPQVRPLTAAAGSRPHKRSVSSGRLALPPTVSTAFLAPYAVTAPAATAAPPPAASTVPPLQSTDSFIPSVHRLSTSPTPASSRPSVSQPATAPGAPPVSEQLPLCPYTLSFLDWNDEQHFRLRNSGALSRYQVVVTILLFALTLAAVSTEASGLGQDPHLVGIRLGLLVGCSVLVLVLLAVSAVGGVNRYSLWVQLPTACLCIAAMALWETGFTLFNPQLSRASRAGAVILFLQILLLGTKPLLFPYAVFASVVCTVLYSLLVTILPSPFETAPQLVFTCIVLYTHLLFLLSCLYRSERLRRLSYTDQLRNVRLQREKAELDLDAKQLKSDFFTLTLERLDIVDVEQQDDGSKVLTSAMEQAMGKLQGLGKRGDLPSDVLKQVLEVIGLLGSGSDLFRPRMEGTDWHEGLGEADEELTRYIFETLHAEQNCAVLPPPANAADAGQPRTPSREMATIAETAAGAPPSHTAHSVSVSEGSESSSPPRVRHVSSSLSSPTGGPGSLYDRSLSHLLHSLDDWNMDVFEVAALTVGKPLFFLGLALMRKFGFIERFGLDKLRVANFLRELEAGYSRAGSNPYHNSLHAADVAISVHFFIKCGRLERYCTELELMSLLIAALAHDFQHPGRNNAFCIAVRDERALLYNDRSVLENFHAAQTFLLMISPAANANLLSSLSPKDYLQCRKLIVDLILATDLAHSNEFLGRFKNWLTAAEATDSRAAQPLLTGRRGSGGAAGGAVHGQTARRSSLGAINPQGSSKSTAVFQSTAVSSLEAEARVMTMKMAIKCADISHSAKRLSLHTEWTRRITEEFYRQGDDEQRLHLPVSPFMDRRKANLAASQCGFMDWIVSPLYSAWFRFLDPEEKRQREMWRERKDRELTRTDSSSSVSTAKQPFKLEIEDEHVTVMEQLRRNREYWKHLPSSPRAAAGEATTANDAAANDAAEADRLSNG